MVRGTTQRPGSEAAAVGSQAGSRGVGTREHPSSPAAGKAAPWYLGESDTKERATWSPKGASPRRTPQGERALGLLDVKLVERCPAETERLQIAWLSLCVHQNRVTWTSDTIVPSHDEIKN